MELFPSIKVIAIAFGMHVLCAIFGSLHKYEVDEFIVWLPSQNSNKNFFVLECFSLNVFVYKFTRTIKVDLTVFFWRSFHHTISINIISGCVPNCHWFITPWVREHMTTVKPNIYRTISYTYCDLRLNWLRVATQSSTAIWLLVLFQSMEMPNNFLRKLLLL